MSREYEDKYRGNSVNTDVVEVNNEYFGHYKGTVRALHAIRNDVLTMAAGVFTLRIISKAATSYLTPQRRKKLWNNCKIYGKALPYVLCLPFDRSHPVDLKTICLQAKKEKAELHTQEPQPQRTETIIHPEATSLLAGITNAGKSILALQIAVAAAGGKDYLTLPHKPPLIAAGQKVLYISTEKHGVPQGRIDAARTALGDNRINFEYELYQHTSQQEPGIGDFAPLYNRLKGWVQQQRGDCLIVIDNLSVFNSQSVQPHVRGFYTKLDNLKTSYRGQGGGSLTFLLVVHTSDPSSDISKIKGSDHLVILARPILMHCKREPKKAASTRYLALHKFKDDGGETDETYDFDYCPAPFPHYELAKEDVNKTADEDVNVNADVNTDANTQAPSQLAQTGETRAKNEPLSEEDVEKIRDLYLKGENTMQEIAELYKVTRQTVDKYTKDLPPRKRKKPDGK